MVALGDTGSQGGARYGRALASTPLAGFSTFLESATLGLARA